MTARDAPRIALPSEPLIDGDTTLRQWRVDDADALVALCQDPALVRWVRITAGYELPDACAYLDSRELAARAGVAAHLAIVATADDRLLGSISLMRYSWPDRRAEIGYWLGAAARGHGHATRAVTTLVAWGFRALALERIELLAAAGNPASLRVAHRAGFTREAVLRSYLQRAGETHDMICHGRLSTD